MAKHKNKTEIIDSIILKEHKSSKSYDYWWCDDSDYWDYDRDYDDFYDWEYDLEDPDLYKEKYINKRGCRVYQTTHIIGKKINMESAYSKQNLRQMKLEAILEGKKLPGEKVYLIDNLSQESLDNLKKIS
jgi:hypothetical protein